MTKPATKTLRRQDLINTLGKAAHIYLMGNTPVLTPDVAVDALVEWLRNNEGQLDLASETDFTDQSKWKNDFEWLADLLESE